MSENKIITRKNHYVPELYLKNWSKNENTIFVYNTLVPNEKIPIWTEKSIRSVAIFRDLYTEIIEKQEIDDVEKWLNIEFENPAKYVFEKIENNKRLKREDWICLSRYVGAQIARTPTMVQRVIQMGENKLPEIIEDAAKRLETNLKKDINFYKNFTDLKKAKDMPPLNVKYDQEMKNVEVKSFIGRSWYLYFFKHLLTNTIKVLSNHTWHIIQAHDDINFMTSDDPVICLNYYGYAKYDFNGGWGSKNSEILFPLTPKHMLYTKIGNEIDVSKLNYSLKYSEMFQRFTIEHARRYIYSKEKTKGMFKYRPRIIDVNAYKEENESFKTWNEQQIEGEANIRFC